LRDYYKIGFISQIEAALEVSKPPIEKSAQYENDDRSKKENGNSNDRIYNVNVVLIEPIDDLGHG